MTPGSVLTIRAGPRALERIRSSGLNAADIEIIPGAAGGPKGLGIAGLDRAIFGEWLPAAPGVRLSAHRALHVPCPLGLAGRWDRLGCPRGRYAAAVAVAGDRH